MDRPCVYAMSTPRRFFAEGINYPESLSAYLTGEEFTHAKAVLRVATGDEIILLDNSGKEYTAIVDKIEKSRLSAHITGVNAQNREPSTPLYLLFGALKGDKSELVVQKATELGAGKIGVFSSQFCSAYMNDNKLARLNKVAREAAKQCLRSRAPEVVYFGDISSALSDAGDYQNKLFFCEFAHESGADISKMQGPVAIMVGSEGGFSVEEASLAEERGWAAMTLGKRILRAETAAVAACALAQYALGELK